MSVEGEVIGFFFLDAIKQIRQKFGDEKVAELGYEPEFGARPMRRVIQDKIESRIAQKILEQDLKRGDFIEIKAEELD